MNDLQEQRKLTDSVRNCRNNLVEKPKIKVEKIRDFLISAQFALLQEAGTLWVLPQHGGLFWVKWLATYVRLATAYTLLLLPWYTLTNVVTYCFNIPLLGPPRVIISAAALVSITKSTAASHKTHLLCSPLQPPEEKSKLNRKLLTLHSMLFYGRRRSSEGKWATYDIVCSRQWQVVLFVNFLLWLDRKMTQELCYYFHRLHTKHTYLLTLVQYYWSTFSGTQQN